MPLLSTATVCGPAVTCRCAPRDNLALHRLLARAPAGSVLVCDGAERVDDLAAIQRSVTTPIATGERLVGVHAFYELLSRGGCSVLQPDLTHCGGLSEGRRIATLAEVHRVALAPHNPQGPVSTAASVELGLATPSYVICEAVTEDVPWREEVASDSHPIERDGMLVRASDRPGLGIEVDLDAVARHPFEQELPQRVFYGDGSVGDW